MEQSNQKVLETIYRAFGEGDVNTVMGLLTDDVEYRISGRGPVSGRFSGKEEVLGLIGQLMQLSNGTFRLEVLDILANERRGVALTRETASRNGQTLDNHAVHVWELRDGKGSRFHGYNEEGWDDFWS
jgi:ketosteroid isomerase-like protein